MLVIWSVDNKRKLPATDLITSVYQAVFKSFILHIIKKKKSRDIKQTDFAASTGRKKTKQINLGLGASFQ